MRLRHLMAGRDHWRIWLDGVEVTNDCREAWGPRRRRPGHGRVTLLRRNAEGRAYLEWSAPGEASVATETREGWVRWEPGIPPRWPSYRTPGDGRRRMRNRCRAR